MDKQNGSYYLGSRLEDGARGPSDSWEPQTFRGHFQEGRSEFLAAIRDVTRQGVIQPCLAGWVPGRPIFRYDDMNYTRKQVFPQIIPNL